MNIGQVIQKVLEAYTLFKNGNKIEAGVLLLQVLMSILQAMPPVAVGVPRAFHASALDLNSATEDEMMEELKRCCSMTQPVNGPVEGPVIDLMVPIIWKLVKKWIGM